MRWRVRSEQVFSCFTCGTNFPSSSGLAVHRTKKHDRPYRVPVVKVARIRTTNLKRKLCDSEDVHNEGGADAPVESSNEIEEYDETEERDEFQAPADDFDAPADDFEASVDEYDFFQDWRPHILHELRVLAMDEGVASTSVAAAIQDFPSWSNLTIAATELAMYGPVPPLDLVASGHFTMEESAISLWGQQYNISIAAHDRLHSIITAVDSDGRATFDVSNLVKTEVQRRKV